MQLRVHEGAADVYAEDVRDGWLRTRHGGDAGVDLRAARDVTVHAGTTEAIPLGVSIAVPRHHVGWITGRSTSVLSLGLLVHEGKIDQGYRGEVHAFCTALGSPVTVAKGDRVCQLVCVRINEPLEGWVVVEELEQHFGTRGVDGLGSTGIR